MPSGVFSVRKAYDKTKMGRSQEDRVNVEKAMFKAHTFHFLLSSAKASLFPFLTIYFRMLGLSATQVGLVFAGQAFMRLWCAPIWTACAKACRKKKCVLMFSTFVLLASSLCLSLAPPSDMESSPLYCRGAPKNVNAGELNNNYNNNTATENVPIANPTSFLNTPEVTGTTSPKDDSVVSSGNNEISTTTTSSPSETPSPATTTTTTVPPTTTTTTKPTTTTKADYESSDLSEDEAADELADKLLELGVKPEDLENLNDDGLATLLQDLLHAGSPENGNYLAEENRKKNQHQSRPSYESEYERDRDSEYERGRIKRHDEGSANDKNTKTNDGKYTWNGFSERLGEEVQAHKTFAFIIALVVVSEMFAAPMGKLADDCWFEYLDVLDVVERYGGHRVWQLVGYVLLPAFAGTLVEKTHCILMNNVPHFMIHFFLFAAFAALAFLAAFGYPVSQNKRTPKQSRFGKGVRILCCDVHSMTMTVTILFLGMMSACIQNFLLWKVQDVGGNEIVMGTSVTVSAFSAMFMYIISNALIKRITHVGAVTLAMITLAGRLVFYSFLWTPWLVLAGEALHGFSFTLLWRAVEMYPDFRINPFIMDRSAFTMINVVYHGLGIGFGSAISGILYDHFGFALLFQGASVAITAWCAMFLLLQKCVKRKMKVRYAKLLQDDKALDESSEDDEDWLEVAMKSGR